MNILVTGANGQLGNEMRIIAGDSKDNYIFTDVNQVEGIETTFLDITDLEAVRHMVSKCQVEAIVNCAAYTNVDAAETNETLAEKLNQYEFKGIQNIKGESRRGTEYMEFYPNEDALMDLVIRLFYQPKS